MEVKVQKVQIYSSSTDILIGLSQMHQYMSSIHMTFIFILEIIMQKKTLEVI